MKLSIIPFILNKIKSGLGIVQDTDTATEAIAQNKYVFWKGKMKKASSAISANDTLSSTNLSDVSGGALNEISGQVGTLSSLNTTAKTSIVSATNEVNTRVTNLYTTSIGTPTFTGVNAKITIDSSYKFAYAYGNVVHLVVHFTVASGGINSWQTLFTIGSPYVPGGNTSWLQRFGLGQSNCIYIDNTGKFTSQTSIPAGEYYFDGVYFKWY